MLYFTDEELWHSDTAVKKNINNKPNLAVMRNLRACAEQLDIVRRLLGKPIYVNSGYRCFELNNIIGGAVNSDHLLGCALDITTREGREEDERLFELIKSSIPYNQLIWENTWIHYSYYRPNKSQIIIY